MVDTTARGPKVPVEPGQVPSLNGDIRYLIPKMGLRNYWYPGMPLHKIPKRRALRRDMLGVELVWFRGVNGDPVAMQDVCPHRGARLSEGHMHWPGAVACPYHGWVFDETGKNVAVLSEGPDSKVCGKPGTEAKVYPTQVLKGVVFVWIGDTDPAPIEEDVPPEFFDPKALIVYNDHIIWHTHWLVALENSMDAHVGYLHRDHFGALISSKTNVGSRDPNTYRPVFTGNGFRGSLSGFGPVPMGNGNQPGAQVRQARPSSSQDTYPNGWKFPKHHFRKYWTWLFLPFFSITRVEVPGVEDPHRWGGGHKLPGMFRAGGGPIQPEPKGLFARIKKRFRYGSSHLFGLYTRWPVSVEPWRTNLWYFHYTRPMNRVEGWYHKFVYNTIYRWMGEYNFSAQDGSCMFNQRYDWPEKLSGTDAEVIQWRKLIVTKAYGGRNAPYDYERDKDFGIEERKADQVGLIPTEVAGFE